MAQRHTKASVPFDPVVRGRRPPLLLTGWAERTPVSPSKVIRQSVGEATTHVCIRRRTGTVVAY